MVLAFVKICRIPHWIKNSFVFVPLIFSKNLFNVQLLEKSFLLFIAFGTLSSSVYILNDYFDIENDRKHKTKKFRPLASGRLSRPEAFSLFLFLLVITFLLALQFSSSIHFVFLAYFIINILYSIWLKTEVIVDILIIAIGFLLRVLAGAFAIDVEVSKWLILTTVFLSLFLAAMKRKSEIKNEPMAEFTRNVLTKYSNDLINVIIGISTTGILISYLLYTFAERTLNNFHTNGLALTTVFVVYGLFRYSYIIFTSNEEVDPTRVYLTDRKLILNSFLYILSIILIIYFNLI